MSTPSTSELQSLTVLRDLCDAQTETIKSLSHQRDWMRSWIAVARIMLATFNRVSPDDNVTTFINEQYPGRK